MRSEKLHLYFEKQKARKHMNMFDEMADKLLDEAEAPQDVRDLFRSQISNILSQKMASLSSMALSNERVEAFSKQKEAIVQDLKDYMNNQE